MLFCDKENFLKKNLYLMKIQINFLELKKKKIILVSN